MKKTNDFGRDSIPLLVLKISVPFMFAQFVNVLYSIVDRIYVGNIPVTGRRRLRAGCDIIIILWHIVRDRRFRSFFCAARRGG